MGASAKVNPTPDNQQAPQVSKDNNNDKNTPPLDSSDLSVAAAIL